MSIEAFSSLDAQEVEQLLEAPAVVTLLIAGSDEKVDKKEKDWASKLVNYRSVTAEVELQPYYEALGDRFESDLTSLMDGWQVGDLETLRDKLSALSPILEKLEGEFVLKLKQSWRTLAEQVAKASGGIIGFGSVSPEEREVIDLSMLD